MLREAALYKKDRSIQIVERCLKRQGLLISEQIISLARLVSRYIKSKTEDRPETTPTPIMYLARDSGTEQFITQFRICIKHYTIYERDDFRDIIDGVCQLSENGGLGPSNWKKIVKDFIDKNWKELNGRYRRELIAAWVSAARLSCHIIIKLGSPKDELRRYGYVKEA